MNALGTLAFEQGLTPDSLLRSAEMTRDENPEASEELHGFAHDLAEIRLLPEAKLS